MSLRSLVAPTTLQIQGRHVTWLARALDRADLWALGLLQRSMALGLEEAKHAASLMHLPTEMQEQIRAEQETAPPDKLWFAQATRLDDEVVCRQIVGAMVDDADHEVRLVLDAADAAPDARPERIWVGSLPLGEVQALSQALLSAWRGEVREGVCFRPAERHHAGTS